MTRGKRGRILEAGRFGFASVLSFLSILGGTFLLHEVLRVRQEVAYALVLASIFLVNFFVLRHWVYRERGREGAMSRQLLHTVMASLAFRCLEYAGFLLLHTLACANYLLSIGCVTGASFFMKFVYYRNAVFGGSRRQEDGNGLGWDRPNSP